MGKKIILAILLILGVIWGYGFVFSTNFIFTPSTKHAINISPNIYLWDSLLSQTIIWYQSNIDISTASIHSSCPTSTQFLEKYEDIYYFSLHFLTEKCRNKNIVLKLNNELLINTASILNIVTKGKIFNLLTDYPTQDLEWLSQTLNRNIKNYTIYETLNSEEIWKYRTYRKRQRKFQESRYQLEVLEGIFIGRWKKYTSPIPWTSLSNQFSKIPNAGRPYREWYTDGIHHWWDIDSDIWQEVVALDEGIIVRIVDNFAYADLERITYGDSLLLWTKIEKSWYSSRKPSMVKNYKRRSYFI